MSKTTLKTLALTGMLAAAATPLAMADENGTAEEQLLASVFPSGCNFSGQFNQQKAMQGLPVPLNSNGDFFYSCDLGLVWHTSEPFSEAVLYVNSTNNFRAEDDGALTPLSGVARYVMSNIFVRLLKGDTGYFTDEFAISQEDAGDLVLLPESEMMRKGLQAIRISKTGDDTTPMAVSIKVTDASGQDTQVRIDNIQEFDFEGKRNAYEQCLEQYSDKTNWCQVLRSPSRYDAF